MIRILLSLLLCTYLQGCFTPLNESIYDYKTDPNYGNGGDGN